VHAAALSLLRIAVMVAGLALAGAAVITQPVLGSYRFTGSERAQPPRMRADVVTLTTAFRPRSADHPDKLDAAAAYIERALRDAGGRVRSQDFVARKQTYRNVIARFGPEHGPLTIVGAHYDAFCDTGDLPGADDNASGTAGLLELARLLGRTKVDTPVMLVAYANEEPPFFGSDEMGSAVHARGVDNVAGMICLEMIGYYSERQPWPNWTFAALYPSQGDFIAVGGGWSDRRLARHVKRALRGAGMRAWSFTGPRETLDASDHRNYWRAGIPAVLVTDTAYLRNPNYHTRNDTAGTLDYVRMARVVDGVYSAVIHTTH
jgi:Zn-dependent M28 family amino/carboxypeptidase